MRIKPRSRVDAVLHLLKERRNAVHSDVWVAKAKDAVKVGSNESNARFLRFRRR